VNPDEFYVYKPNLAAGRPAILRKSMGSKATPMSWLSMRKLLSSMPRWRKKT